MGVYVGKLLRNGLIHVLYGQNIFRDHFIVKKGKKCLKWGPRNAKSWILRNILPPKCCNLLNELKKYFG